MRKIYKLLWVLFNVSLVYSAQAAVITSNNTNNWITPSGLNYSEVVYAQVIDSSNQLISNTNSKLAVFNGTNCAGVTTLIAGPNGPLFQLPVYSDTSPTAMTYQVFNGALNLVSLISQGLSFTNGATVGSISSPITLNAVPEPGENALYLISAVLFGLMLLNLRRAKHDR